MIAALTLLPSLGAVSSAAAAWTRFSPPTAGSVVTHMGLTRTADGVLHVAWIAGDRTQNMTLMHTSFSPAGKLRATTAMTSGWATLEPPALVTAPDGSTLAGYWGGRLGDDPNHQELNAAYSGDGGRTWTLTPYNLLSGKQVGMDRMSAARLGENYYEAWGSYVHFGYTASPAYHLTASPANGCCGYDATVAAQAAPAAVLVAWYSNQTHHDGVYTQAVDPASGQPVGSASAVPGTRGVVQALVPPALVGREDAPGFVVAYKSGYPVGSRLLAWIAGSRNPVYLGSSQHDIDCFALAAASGGRVWAVWDAYRNGHRQIVARRSRANLSAWGEPVVIKPPSNGDLWALSASSIGGSLDVMGAFGDQGHIADYQTRVLPGLSVSARPRSPSRRHRRPVRFTVLDAGSPVKGADIQVGGARGHTGSHGVATLQLGPFGPQVRRFVVKVSARGYTGTSLELAVR